VIISGSAYADSISASNSSSSVNGPNPFSCAGLRRLVGVGSAGRLKQFAASQLVVFVNSGVRTLM
jgi:hypothetical protein